MKNKTQDKKIGFDWTTFWAFAFICITVNYSGYVVAQYGIIGVLYPIIGVIVSLLASTALVTIYR